MPGLRPAALRSDIGYAVVTTTNSDDSNLAPAVIDQVGACVRGATFAWPSWDLFPHVEIPSFRPVRPADGVVTPTGPAIDTQ